MKLVVQRVNKAQVFVKESGNIVGKIGKGYFVLVGVKKGDSEEDAELLAEKLSKLRVTEDKTGKMNLNLKDAKASVLVVSQFTLLGDVSHGNRPSFINAELPGKAEKVYKRFITMLKEKGLVVENGSFGAYMKINLELDGPVTILY